MNLVSFPLGMNPATKGAYSQDRHQGLRMEEPFKETDGQDLVCVLPKAER